MGNTGILTDLQQSWIVGYRAACRSMKELLLDSKLRLNDAGSQNEIHRLMIELDRLRDSAEQWSPLQKEV